MILTMTNRPAFFVAAAFFMRLMVVRVHYPLPESKTILFGWGVRKNGAG